MRTSDKIIWLGPVHSMLERKVVKKLPGCRKLLWPRVRQHMSCPILCPIKGRGDEPRSVATGPQDADAPVPLYGLNLA